MSIDLRRRIRQFQMKTSSAQKDAAFVKDTGVEEDREAACSIQRGLMGDGNTHFTFGRFEKAIVHFHRQLNVHIEELSS